MSILTIANHSSSSFNTFVVHLEQYLIILYHTDTRTETHTHAHPEAYTHAFVRACVCVTAIPLLYSNWRSYVTSKTEGDPYNMMSQRDA